MQYHPEVTTEIVEGWIEETRAAGTAEDPARAFGELSVTLEPWSAYGRELFSRWAAQAR